MSRPPGYMYRWIDIDRTKRQIDRQIDIPHVPRARRIRQGERVQRGDQDSIRFGRRVIGPNKGAQRFQTLDGVERCCGRKNGCIEHEPGTNAMYEYARVCGQRCVACPRARFARTLPSRLPYGVAQLLVQCIACACASVGALFLCLCEHGNDSVFYRAGACANARRC